MHTKQNKKIGFTLIELLVVVSIIAVLSAIIIASLAGAREKSKLSKVKAEHEEALLALEVYNNEYGGYPYEATYGDRAQFCMAPTGTPDCLFLGTTVTRRITAINNIQVFQDVDRDPMTASVLFPKFKNDITLNTSSGQIRGIIYIQCNSTQVQTINGVDVCVVDSSTTANNAPFILYAGPSSTGNSVVLKYKIPGRNSVEADYSAVP